MSITLDIPNNIHEASHVSPADAEKRLKLELAFEITRQVQLVK
jgi:hypothetical protein